MFERIKTIRQLVGLYLAGVLLGAGAVDAQGWRYVGAMSTPRDAHVINHADKTVQVSHIPNGTNLVSNEMVMGSIILEAHMVAVIAERVDGMEREPP